MPFDLRRLSVTTVAWLLAGLGLAAHNCGCATVRRAQLAVTPTVPPAAGATCPAVPWRCAANVPERCAVTDGEARWWPTHSLGDDGRPAPCRRCVVEATAHCAPEVMP